MSTAAARIADLLEDVPTASNPPGPHPAPAPDPAAEEPPRADGPVLVVTVVWGDLAQVPADLHVTGHYQSVAPAAAELALDAAISAGPRRTITEHTKLGWIGAQLGEVTYFPCKDGGPVRTAAVVGMGPMGTLTERRAHQMYASLLGEAVALGHVGTMATVLIGSGTGNLTVNQAARALVGGFAGILASAGPTQPTQPTPTVTQPTSAPAPRLTDVFVVEVDRLRAEQLHLALTRAAAKLPRLRIGPELREESGGRLFAPSAAVYALTALTGLARSEGAAAHDGSPGGTDPPDSPDPSDALHTVLAGFAPDIRREIREQLAHLAEVARTDLSLTVGRAMDDPEASGPGSGSVPVRMSVQSGIGGLRWAALTGRATVPERLVPVDMDLLRELVERLTEPTVEDAIELPDLLSRFVVPPDFQRLVTDDATVLLELDRDTASVPWEFLAGSRQAGGEQRDPLAIRTRLSRQLRTPYSRVMTEGLSDGPLRALVIGDPGDPEKGFQLPGARTEALAVATRLRDLGAKVTLFVGAANSTRQPGVDPARRLDVLRVLLCGGNHIVHYCGHSDFDPTGTGRRSGWVFADGLLTAQELALLERPPRIVVANACYTARLGGATGPGTPGTPGKPGAQPGAADQSPWGNPQAALVPSLADEFLRMGVGHYIGAAWRIPDDQGVSFAEEFYTHLLTGGAGGSGGSGGSEDAPPTVGDAVRAARKRLYEQRATGQRPPDTAPNGQRWSAWAAYQHYGDAADPFDRPDPSDRPGGS
ncbi:CHAT domain-containing protein [Streptomyces sp. NPDC001586]|uniref:CHAT domain-containing protein n=1 Tax=Streptomyces sp. NPDC001586 TaxID=3154387 RepID=UPI00332771F8